MNCLEYLEMNSDPEKIAKTLSEGYPEKLVKALSIARNADEEARDVLHELKDQGLPDGDARFIAGGIYQWMTEKNPYYLDEAFLFLYQVGGAPTRTMLRQDAICRAVRMEGKNLLKGTASGAEKCNADSMAMMQMAYLVVSEGLSVAAAARKVAALWDADHPKLKQQKASTLERNYSKLKKRGLEEVTSQGAAKMHPKELERLKNIPDCPDVLIGARR